MVSEEGLEPSCLATADFEPALYTNSSIPTCGSDGWTRTTTESILSRLPLPIGLHRHVARGEGLEPSNSRVKAE